MAKKKKKAPAKKTRSDNKGQQIREVVLLDENDSKILEAKAKKINPKTKKAWGKSAILRKGLRKA